MYNLYHFGNVYNFYIQILFSCLPVYSYKVTVLIYKTVVVYLVFVISCE